MKRIIALLLSFLVGNSAFGIIYLTVSGANVKKAKIAVGKIHPLGESPTNRPDLAVKVREAILSDLELTNLFEWASDAVVEPLDKASEFYNMDYEKWSATSASFVLKLAYRIQNGELFLETLFYDVPGKKKIFGTRYHYNANRFSRVVHALTEDIMKELTGEKGLFFSRLVMVCRDLKRRKNPPKDVYVTDPDGESVTQLTNDNTLSLSPSWAGDTKNITYTQFDWVQEGRGRKRGTVLKKHNLQTGERKKLSARDGMNSGASWSPSGNRIAATLSFTGRPEIYLLSPTMSGDPEPLSRTIKWKKIGGEGYQQGSVNQLFDVEPNWSPDEKQIVFSSARTGHPMIYTVNLATREANQLTFAGQYNASPAWSPKGDKILFAAQRTGEGNFDIYAIDPDGNNLNRVTSGDRPGRRFNNENPTWAPTGRHFAYASNESGHYAIYVSTLDGSVKRRVSPDGKECSTPSWSSYIGPN